MQLLPSLLRYSNVWTPYHEKMELFSRSLNNFMPWEGMSCLLLFYHLCPHLPTPITVACTHRIHEDPFKKSDFKNSSTGYPNVGQEPTQDNGTLCLELLKKEIPSHWITRLVGWSPGAAGGHPPPRGKSPPENRANAKENWLRNEPLSPDSMVWALWI